MSYEGFERYLCANGHRRTFDCYDAPEDGAKCSCGAVFIFRHAVDQTNGYDPALDIDFEIDVPAKICMCRCGNEHVVEEARYKIPVRRKATKQTPTQRGKKRG